MVIFKKVDKFLARPTIAYINKENLKANFNTLKGLLQNNELIMSVVKSNGYGHGGFSVAKVLSQCGSDSFGVATASEAIELRTNGEIKEPIFILGGLYLENFKDLVDYNLTPLVYDLEILKELNDFCKKPIEVHLKMDTGMGRLGFLPNDLNGNLEDTLNEIKNLENITITGVMTHLSEAEEGRDDFSKTQLERFISIASMCKNIFGDSIKAHMANSSAIVDFPYAHMDMVRPGIMLYGSYPEERFRSHGEINLKPVMELKTKVLQVRKVSKDFPVSYKRTFNTSGDSVLATLPIGYGDGLPRELSNKGEVLINGKRCPIVGLICMDLCVVDVTKAGSIKIGDEVVIIGCQTVGNNSETITAEEVAALCGTISYEIFCQITNRVKRVYI